MQREGKPGKEGASGAAQLAALAWMGGMTGSRSVSSYSLVQFPGHICVLAKNWAGGGGGMYLQDTKLFGWFGGAPR